MDEDRARVLDAAGLMLAYAVLVGLADNAVPGIASGMSLWQFLATRAVLSLLLLAGFVALRPGTTLRPRCWRAVMLRASVHAAAIGCFFAAMASLAPPQALAALLTAPLFAAAFGAAQSRRPPGPATAAAICCGFAGVMLALPGGPGHGPGLLLGLLAGALYAASNLMAGRSCAAEHPLTLTATYLAASGVVGALAMAALAGAGADGGFLTRAPVWPAAGDWAILSAHSAANLIGVTLMLAAWQRADAARAGALHYLVLPASCLWSQVLWGWQPDRAEAAGMTLIVLAGLMVLGQGGRLPARPPGRPGGRGRPVPHWPPSFQAACFWPAKRS